MAHSTGRLRKHFMFCHFRSKVAVVQKGKDPLPRCDLCGMHMPAGHIIRYRKIVRCNRNTQMRWRRRDVAIAARCPEATFSLRGEDESERIKGVGRFKYLRILMDQSYYYWPEVLHNIRKASQVWGHIEKLLWREGAEL